MQTGRPVNRTPLYNVLRNQGAVMGQIGGWERAMWFERAGVRDTGELNFHEEPWHAAVRAECETVRDAVGVMDHGGFTKFSVSGPGAADYLSMMFCGVLPAVGRVRLSYLLTPKGRIWSESTIARLAEDRFLLFGPTLAIDRDHDWLVAHLPDSGVTLTKGHAHDGALLVMGPKSRQVLSALTDADLSAEATPWLSVAEIEIAGVAATALRISYVGELGWELHLPSADLPALFAAIQEAGATHGICNFGSYALNAMRIEKGYHGWGSDFGTEYTLFDAGLARFANMNKGGFVGRDAVLAQSQTAPEWDFLGLEVTDSGPEPLPSDPIIVDGNVVGYLTSVTQGYRTGKLIALGYVERGTLPMGAACQVQAFGSERAAIRHNPHAYDPENARLRDEPPAEHRLDLHGPASAGQSRTAGGDAAPADPLGSRGNAVHQRLFGTADLFTCPGQHADRPLSARPWPDGE